jgi:hypothetical protein
MQKIIEVMNKERQQPMWLSGSDGKMNKNEKIPGLQLKSCETTRMGVRSKLKKKQYFAPGVVISGTGEG